MAARTLTTCADAPTPELAIDLTAYAYVESPSPLYIACEVCLRQTVRALAPVVMHVRPKAAKIPGKLPRAKVTRHYVCSVPCSDVLVRRLNIKHER